MAADRIRVTAPGGDYDILIEPDLLVRVGEFIPDGRAVIVTNTMLGRLYGEPLMTGVPNSNITAFWQDSHIGTVPNAALVTIPEGEQFKNLETVAQLYSEFVAAGLDRSGTVIALGGGVVGDTAGFAAATYMRGIRLIQIPTTLLAMVDSSVGGKVGVDLPQGKNLIGAFKQPDVVLIDPSVLRTLSDKQFSCGMAEVVKHGLLADAELLNRIEVNYHEFMTRRAIAEWVQRAVQVKVDVVQQDPYEKNIRAYLNLGHTFAHAIERVSGYSWLHGEAVGVGLVAAARLSYALKLCDANLPERVEQVVQLVGLPTHLNGFDADSLYTAMATDKKWQGGHSRFVLLRGVCQPTIVEDVPKAAVISVLQGLQ